MLILINATSCHSGGGAEMLRQITAAIAACPGHTYAVAGPDACATAGRPLARLAWDLRGCAKWATRHGLKPGMVLSLHSNAARGFAHARQVVYVQNALPFAARVPLGLRHFLVYRCFYRAFIRLTLPRKATIAVQTHHMRKLVCRGLGLPESRVAVCPPMRPPAAEAPTPGAAPTGTFTFFYPADAQRHKNHALLCAAVTLLRERGFVPAERLRIILTLEKGVLDCCQGAVFENAGWLSREQALQTYSQCCALLFPSLIESYGLPLFEAQSRGLPVLALDAPYSREACAGYDRARLLENDARQWAAAMEELIMTLPGGLEYADH